MKNKILLIEDDLATIDIYETAFKKSGFDMKVIKWGNEALELVDKINEDKAKKPDLVLLDLILPDKNGIKILEAFKKGKKTKDIPVFVITNYTDKEMQKMSRSLKSEKHLLKTDYTPRQLIEMIERKLGRKVKKKI